MNEPFPFVPQPPTWNLDWRAIEEAFDWIRALGGCPQDPIHHAEGDVLIHTRMVTESLVALDAWRDLSAVDREVVFAATLMHDIAKPAKTKEENGRITSRGHAKAGTYRAREVLWDLWPAVCSAESIRFREAICGIVRHHGLPLYFLDRRNTTRTLITASMAARLDHVAIMATADVHGRHCGDQQELLDRIAMFREFASEAGCLSAPRTFANDQTRFRYFQDESLSADAELFDDTRCRVRLMSGLPAAGKDHWLAQNDAGVPTVSLDEIRREIDAPATGDQTRVLEVARERARAFLRAAEPFSWNATNLTRALRDPLIRLFSDYKAATDIVFVETSVHETDRRNAARSDAVPRSVIAKLRRKLDFPTAEEAHSIAVVPSM